MCDYDKYDYNDAMYNKPQDIDQAYNHGKSWTTREEAIIKEMYRNGLTLGKIASSMGRTLCSITNRLEKLGVFIPYPVGPQHNINSFKSHGTLKTDKKSTWSEIESKTNNIEKLSNLLKKEIEEYNLLLEKANYCTELTTANKIIDTLIKGVVDEYKQSV